MTNPQNRNHIDTDWPPKMAVCVGMVVCYEQKILFIRQSSGQPLAGQWSIPWGMVDHLETPENAAVRETYEEGGIQVAVDGLIGIQNLPSPGWLGIIFLGHPVAGQPHPDGVESDRAAYLSLPDIQAFDEPIEPWCQWLACRVLSGVYVLTPFAPGNPYSPCAAFL